MEKIVSARHFQLRDEIKTSIMDGLDRLEGEYQKLTSARVILDHDKAGFSCEVILHGKHLEIEAKGKGTEPLPAAVQALEKADRQLRKHLEKVHDHGHVSTAENELKAEAKAQKSDD